MSARERLYLALLALFIGAAAVSLGFIALAQVPLEQLGTSLEMVYGSLQFAILAAVLLVLAFLLLFLSIRRGECVETLLQQGPLGEVRICFKIGRASCRERV